MKDSFSKMHPIVNFVFFAFVIVLSMFLLNPICLAISLVCALSTALYLNGHKATKLCLVYLLPMILLIVIINPVFNHEGITMLSYLPSGNPLTLESIVYGIVTAIMMASVILWFSSFNKVITSDKFVYLFGKIIPSLSLVLSMTLRFVPKFSTQFKIVRNAQKCIGNDISDGSIIKRIKNLIKVFSIMISWAMENAIESADSMKSRGYGLKGRTAFSIYHFCKRDAVTLVIEIVLGVFITVTSIYGATDISYFPSIKLESQNVWSILTYTSYFALMILPMIINVGEDIKWKRLRSTI